MKMSVKWFFSSLTLIGKELRNPSVADYKPRVRSTLGTFKFGLCLFCLVVMNWSSVDYDFCNRFVISDISNSQSKKKQKHNAGNLFCVLFR